MKPRIAKPDWDRVHQLACDIVNASSMGDEIYSVCPLGAAAHPQRRKPLITYNEIAPSIPLRFLPSAFPAR